MNTSPSPTNSPNPSAPAFYQRKTTQVQAMQWPHKDGNDWPGDTVAAIFNWVAEAGGRILWRTLPEGSVDAATGAPEMYPAIVDDEGGEVQVADGEWIVRLPGYTDPETKKPSPVSRWIVETEADFGEDYTDQQRQRLAAQDDFLKQAERIAKRAEIDEASMTPAERREASSIELHSLGNVIGRGGQQ
jgi:hypothetical protein